MRKLIARFRLWRHFLELRVAMWRMDRARARFVRSVTKGMALSFGKVILHPEDWK